MKLDRILVLCTGNICRSPMAEALLALALGDGSEPCVVASAGIGALVDHPAAALAVELMTERGIDLTAHRARQLSGALARPHDLILTMDGEQRRHVELRWPLLHGRVHKLGRWGGFDIADPYRKPREDFEESLALIERGIEQWLPILRS